MYEPGDVQNQVRGCGRAAGLCGGPRVVDAGGFQAAGRDDGPKSGATTVRLDGGGEVMDAGADGMEL